MIWIIFNRTRKSKQLEKHRLCRSQTLQACAGVNFVENTLHCSSRFFGSRENTPAHACKVQVCSCDQIYFKSLLQVTKEKFHELRYAVAEVLNHMQQLEKRSVLSIET